MAGQPRRVGTRSVGVRRASQRKGWVPPTDAERVSPDVRQRGTRDSEIDAAERAAVDTMRAGGLPLIRIPDGEVGKPARVDPHGLTKGGGVWLALAAETGRVVQHSEVYPCRCEESRQRSYGRGCSRKWCPCSGRPILPGSAEDRELPDDCCARTINSVEMLRAEQDELEIAKRALQAENAAKQAKGYGKDDGTGHSIAGVGDDPDSVVNSIDSDNIRSDGVTAEVETSDGVAANPLQAVAQYQTYLDRQEDYAEQLREQLWPEGDSNEQSYEEQLEAAKRRLRENTCDCATPWDNKHRNKETGIHCVECHENFQTIMAYEMHTQGAFKPCKYPSDVINRKEWGGDGRSLLILGQKDGYPMWALNRTAKTASSVR